MSSAAPAPKRRRIGTVSGPKPHRPRPAYPRRGGSGWTRLASANGVTAATTRRRTAGMLAVAAGAALIVSACASTEHAAARQAQAPLLARAAEHFNQAAADADRAAVYLDRAAGTMLAINGVEPAHVQGFSELELSLRYAAHVLREGADCRAPGCP